MTESSTGGAPLGTCATDDIPHRDCGRRGWRPLPVQGAHTRTTPEWPETGADYCAECSEAASDLVAWPCQGAPSRESESMPDRTAADRDAPACPAGATPSAADEYQYRLAFMVIVDTDGEFDWAAREAMTNRYREALDRIPVGDLVRCTDLTVEQMKPIGEVWS